MGPIVKRFDRAYAAGLYVAQEARKNAHDGDFAYTRMMRGGARFTSAAIVDTQSPSVTGDSAAADPFGSDIRSADRGGQCPGSETPSTPGAAITPWMTTAYDPSPGPASLPSPGTLTLPWPPSGQHAHGHADNQRYLLPHVKMYRERVAWEVKRQSVPGRYVMHVHLSPPDRRERDMDNALKTIFDALRHAGYIEADSLAYMRGLHVSTDELYSGQVRALAQPCQ